MDDFRKIQKQVSPDFSKGEHPHGCPCCRKYPDTSEHKGYASRIARVRLKRQDQTKTFHLEE